MQDPLPVSQIMTFHSLHLASTWWTTQLHQTAARSHNNGRKPSGSAIKIIADHHTSKICSQVSPNLPRLRKWGIGLFYCWPPDFQSPVFPLASPDSLSKFYTQTSVASSWCCCLAADVKEKLGTAPGIAVLRELPVMWNICPSFCKWLLLFSLF